MEKLALLVDYVRRTMEYLDNTDAVTLLIKYEKKIIHYEK